MPQIFQNFIFRSKLPNFERDAFDTWDEMVAVNPDWMDEGHISYLRENGKHYRFSTENGKAKWTMLVPEEVEQLDDVLVYDTKEDMANANPDEVELGRIAYCRADKQIYYFAYDQGYEIDDPEQAVFDQYGTGWFKLLVDIADSEYVKESELSEMGYVTRDEVSDIKAKGIKTFNTLSEMKNYVFSSDEEDANFIAYGQIVFCKETTKHYYCYYNTDIAVQEEANAVTGYFKQIEGLTEVSLTGLYNPSVTRRAWVEEEIGDLAGYTMNGVTDPVTDRVKKKLKDMPYDDLFDKIIFKKVNPEFEYPEAFIDMLPFNGWDGEWLTEDPKTIVMKVGDTSPVAGKFTSAGSTRGKVVYKHSPNSDMTEGKELPWAGEIVNESNVRGDETASYVYCIYDGKELKGTQLPTTVALGDQKYYFRVYYKSGAEDSLVNSHGESINDKLWKHDNYIDSSNYIVINGSKPWYKVIGDEYKEQPLIKWEDEMEIIVDLDATAVNKQIFVTPRRPKSISVYNELSGSYAPSFMEDYIYDEVDEGYSYEFNTEKCGHRGAVKLKVVF